MSESNRLKLIRQINNRGYFPTFYQSCLYLVVSDIEAARADLIRRGVAVSEIFHQLPGAQPAPGPDPERRSYATYATFRDPDGNGWLLQEIRQRLPGR